jgi:hypothetical protein
MIDEKIERLMTFKQKLVQHDETSEPSLREWLNQNKMWVRREVVEARCLRTVTISPPPAVGGLVLRRIDPFDCMFDAPYSMSLVPGICDMIDSTIGVLSDPPPTIPRNVTPPSTRVMLL